MKLSLVAVAATVAVASAVGCDLTKISPLLMDQTVAICTADSGFSFMDLSKPTAESLPKLCSSTACKTVLDAAKGLGLGDCALLGMKLEADLIAPIQTACAGRSATAATSTGGSSAGSSAGSSSGSLNDTIAAVMTTPAPVTTGASSSSAASSGSATKPLDSAETPTAVSKTPAPADTTAASSASPFAAVSASTTAAVVVAIAMAAFL